MTKRVHASTVTPSSTPAYPQSWGKALNPWELLALRKKLPKGAMPSIFAQDPYFCRGKQTTNSSEQNALDLGVLSSKGEASYIDRTAPRRKGAITITKSVKGEIPQAMRTSKRGA
jgi:hypothetical protein